MFLLMAISWVPYIFSEIASSGKVTTSNVESNVKSWVETFHMGIQKLPDDPTEYFMYNVTNRSGRHVLIHRNRGLERYLQFQADITVADEDRKKMQTLNPQDASNIVRSLMVEVSRQRMGSAGIQIPLTTFSVVKSIPIELLSEATFAQLIDEIDSAEVLMIATFDRELSLSSAKR